MDAARKFNCKKIIFSSASSIVGELKYNPVDEIYPCVPKTPYAVAKYAIEQYLIGYQKLFKLNYPIFRFFNVYGPWQYPESRAVIRMVYKKLKTEGAFTFFGNWTHTCDFIYVKHIAQFFVKAIQNNVKNEILNMGTGKATTIKVIVETSGKLLKINPKINYLPPPTGEIDDFVADMTKIKHNFGETPKINLVVGLKKTFRWFNNRT